MLAYDIRYFASNAPTDPILPNASQAIASAFDSWEELSPAVKFVDESGSGDIFFQNSLWIFDPDFPAITETRDVDKNGCIDGFFMQINVVDFGEDEWWNPSTNDCPPDNSWLDFRSVMTHEIGHILGFRDVSGSCYQYTVMAEAILWGECRQCPLSEDYNAVKDEYGLIADADISRFAVLDGVGMWQVSSECRTKGYMIEGSNSSHGPWTQCTGMLPPNVGSYSVDVPSSKYAFFRLVEIERSGRRLIHEISMARNHVQNNQAIHSPTEVESQNESDLLKRLDVLRSEWKTNPINLRSRTAASGREKYVIFTTPSLGCTISY